jgi:hypothetical protein
MPTPRTPKRATRRPRRWSELPTTAGLLLASAKRHDDKTIVSVLTVAGPGNLRSDASACPRGLDFGEVEGWLREAVRDGSVSAVLDGDFPRYAWKRVDDRVYEARLSNAGLGQYKGYPIEDHEAPGWLP